MINLRTSESYYKITKFNSEEIATVQYLSPVCARITYWDQRGPLAHLDLCPEAVKSELVQNDYTPANWAIKLLQEWSRQLDWPVAYLADQADQGEADGEGYAWEGWTQDFRSPSRKPAKSAKEVEGYTWEGWN